MNRKPIGTLLLLFVSLTGAVERMSGQNPAARDAAAQKKTKADVLADYTRNEAAAKEDKKPSSSPDVKQRAPLYAGKAAELRRKLPR